MTKSVLGNQDLEAIQTRRSQTGSNLVTRQTMLRIDKLLDKTPNVLKLSGRIQEENLSGLQTEIEQCAASPKLDLKDVNLLDRPTVRFLMQCESRGVQLVNCPLFIQEWITRERHRAVPPPNSE